MEHLDTASFMPSIFRIHDAFRAASAESKILSVREYQILTAIRELTEDKPQGIALKELSKAVRLTPAAISPLVDSLVRNRLAVRTDNPEDRRSVMLKLTDEGRIVHDRFQERIEALSKKMLSGLSPADAAVFLNRLTEIAESLDKD